jgi:plastocyanin
MEVKMKNTWLIAFLILVVLISGCTGQKTETQPVTTNTVDINGFAFNPDTITITKGTTVTWTNKDSAQHTVTEINNAFSSELLNQGQTYSHTFNETGTFEYQCHIHPNMRGKVIVS